jgi:hypothetical protein
MVLLGFVMGYEFIRIGELRDIADDVNKFLKYVKVRVVTMLGRTYVQLIDEKGINIASLLVGSRYDAHRLLDALKTILEAEYYRVEKYEKPRRVTRRRIKVAV